MSIEQLHRTNRELKAKFSYAREQVSLTLMHLDKAEQEIERLNALLKERNKGFFNLTCYALALNTAGIALLSFLIWLK